MVSSRLTGAGGQATTICTVLKLNSSLERSSAARAVESMKLTSETSTTEAQCHGPGDAAERS
jgi:hypothetical protein